MIDNPMEARDEDFVIRVRPALHEGEWTGEVDLSILTHELNPLDDASFDDLMHFCTMVCATVPMMEKEESIRNIVEGYVSNLSNTRQDAEEKQIEVDKKDVASSVKDGNIITVDFFNNKNQKLH